FKNPDGEPDPSRIFSPESGDSFFLTSQVKKSGTDYLAEINHWPQGIIPISFSATLPLSLRKKVLSACQVLASLSVSCVDQTTEENFLLIKKSPADYSN